MLVFRGLKKEKIACYVSLQRTQDREKTRIEDKIKRHLHHASILLVGALLENTCSSIMIFMVLASRI